MLKILMLCLVFGSFNSWAEESYQVMRVNELPVIDGSGDEEIWQKVPILEVMDVVANHKLYFSGVHNGESIVIKIRFPDASANREHKTLVWDNATSSYKSGIKREDSMVLKWAMNTLFRDLTLSSNEPYHADIWYWKAFGTDPLGYADDKYQIYSKVPSSKAKRLRSKDGDLFFLQRRGDKGKSSYQTNIVIEKRGIEEPKYKHRQPEGSRADITAKGGWNNGEWTVEFLRKLDTGHDDDIRLITGKKFLLGLSRYEIAGRETDESIEIPLFGSGEVGELIELILE